uniref:AAA_12 domain-containing protein n=1 Tax=Caenorhabditis japonica TaxID=281687 RepID=A0A8R1DUA3_CAEJA
MCGFYKPNSFKRGKDVPPVATATEYYVLERKDEVGVALAVRQDTDYHIFKSFKDLSYPACILNEASLRNKLSPAAQPPILPKLFLIEATIFLPFRKCYRFGLCFNRNSHDQSLVKEFLEDVSKLTVLYAQNYRPHLPTSVLLRAEYLDSLESWLLSTDTMKVLNAAKSVRSVKLQSSSATYSDYRLIHFTIMNGHVSKCGGIYVTMKTTAHVSTKCFRAGSFVKLDCITTEPIIGSISRLTSEEDQKLKTMVVFITPTCKIIENAGPFEENIASNIDVWSFLREALSIPGTTLGVQCLDLASPYDVLMSSEKTLIQTELGKLMITGVASAASKVNAGETRPIPLGLYTNIYDDDTTRVANLTTEEIIPFASALSNYTPTNQQLLIYEAILDKDLAIVLVESGFGAGKTVTAAAAARAKLILDKKCRILLTAQTNSAVYSFIASSNLPQFFDADNFEHWQIRPLVLQSHNWREKHGLRRQTFDLKMVMARVFVRELRRSNPKFACRTTKIHLISMFHYVIAFGEINIRDVFAHSLLCELRRIREMKLSREETIKLFFEIYKPNLFFGTMDMCVATFGLFPCHQLPNMVMVDESTMIQPIDLLLFTSKLARQTCEYGIRYVLIGDNKQLEPFNAVRAIASLNVSPNQILLVNGIEPLKLTEVYRCHPAATKILSNVFYSGRLSSGRSYSDFYLQSRLPEEMFRCGSLRAFDIRFNTFQSNKIVQSRSNEGEAAEIGFYAKRLIEEFEFLPSEIVVITPYTAQRDLLESYVPEEVRCTTTRKFQGAESPIVLFSATHDGSKSKIWDDEDGVNNVQFRVGSTGETSFVNLIDDDSVILVSLSRSTHFTVIFGNEAFLSSIPTWKNLIDAINA